MMLSNSKGNTIILDMQEAEADNWNYCVEHVRTKQHLVDIQLNVKNPRFLFTCGRLRIRTADPLLVSGR